MTGSTAASWWSGSRPPGGRSEETQSKKNEKKLVSAIDRYELLRLFSVSGNKVVAIVDGNVPFIECLHPRPFRIVPRHLAGGYGDNVPRLRQWLWLGVVMRRNAKRQRTAGGKAAGTDISAAVQRNHFSITFVHHRVGFSNAVFHAERVKRKPHITAGLAAELKYTRLRASTLGPGFDPDDIRAVIAGERPIPELPKDGPASPRRVNLIIDIQARMAQGKGPAYERWAKVYNLKQMAAALQYLREHDLMDYDALAASTEAAVDRAHKLAGELRDTEAALSKTSELMGAVVQYAKTRPVFDGYKAARYSRKYLAQHEAELADYRAAKATMSDLLGGAKLPKMDTLKKERRELSEKKKALYAEYRKAQADMRQAVAVKANIDHLLGHADEQKK